MGFGPAFVVVVVVVVIVATITTLAARIADGARGAAAGVDTFRTQMTASTTVSSS